MEQKTEALENLNKPQQSYEVELFQYIHTLRRLWWVILLGGLIFGGSFAVYAKLSPPLFTAEVILERNEVPQGMNALQFSMVAQGTSEGAINSQLEVLRSDAVLLPAVDALGLRLNVSGDLALRAQLFGQVEIDLAAEPRNMMLEQRDGGVVLLDSESAEVLSVSDSRGWLSGPGFQLQVVSPELVIEPISVSILFPEDAADRLRGLLTAQRVRGTNLISLSITSPNAEFSAQGVNAVARAHEDFAAARSTQNARRSRVFVEEQLAQISDSLDLARSQLVDYQNTARTLDPILESTIIADRMTTAQEELRMLEFTELVLQDLLTSLNSGVSPTDAFQGIMAIGRDMVPGIELTYSKLQELYEERSRLTSGQFGFTEQGPQVQVLDSLISETRSDIRGMVNQSLSLVTARRNAEEEQVEILESQLQEIPGRSSTFGTLREEVESVKQVYDILVNSYYETRMLEAVETGDVQVLSAATVPLRPDDPNTLRNLIIALIVGFSVGAGGVVVLQSLDTKIRDVSQAQIMVARDVLAVIPRETKNNKKRRGGRGKDGSKRGDPFQEAFGGLRTSLRYSAELDPDKTSVVVVTSPNPSEGKTTVATNLARMLSLQDMKVLLIDADLRRPSVHKVLSIKNELGLGDYLRRREDGWSSLPQNLEDTDVHVMTAGTQISNPAEVLGGKGLQGLINDARDKFDAIVIDSPPVLAVTDTLLISETCDAVVLVGRINQTDRFSLRRAMEELDRIATPVAGLVVNDMGPKDGYSPYGGYYGSYGSYGY